MITERQELYSLISDAYKDLHNFRPASRNTGEWDDLSLTYLRDWYADLCVQCNDQFDQERAQQEENAVKFENSIEEIIDLGAKNRETAIRWLEDALPDYDNDWSDYVWGIKEWYNLPGNYNYAEGVYYNANTGERFA
jgi:hypothetical protein